MDVVVSVDEAVSPDEAARTCPVAANTVVAIVVGVEVVSTLTRLLATLALHQTPVDLDVPTRLGGIFLQLITQDFTTTS